MGLELRWRTSLSATCLHAALCQQEGLPTVDDQLAVAIAPEAAALHTEVMMLGDPRHVLLELCSLSAEYENNRELAERTVARLASGDDPAAVSRLEGHITGLEAAVLKVHPEIAQQLAVRGRPLREQWEARGPGLLRAMGRMTDPAIVPEFAEVVLVSPYAGGHGTAHSRSNRVIYEAVLTNPVPEIPEVVRLAWLLAQLNYDLAVFTDQLAPARLAVIGPLANLPAALAAGEEVELTTCDAQQIELALAAWHFPVDLAAGAASTLWQWWNTVQNGSQRWPVALAGLEAMLFG